MLPQEHLNLGVPCSTRRRRDAMDVTGQIVKSVFRSRLRAAWQGSIFHSRRCNNRLRTRQPVCEPTWYPATRFSAE